MLAEGDQTMEKKKTEGQKLEKDLSYKKENFFVVSSDEKIKAAFDYAEDYKKYIDLSKTEREAVKTSIALCEEKGYKEYRFGDELKAGGRYYDTNRGKSLAVSKSVPPTSERTESEFLLRISIRRGSISNRSPFTKIRRWLFLKRIITAESKNINGRQFLSLFTERLL